MSVSVGGLVVLSVPGSLHAALSSPSMFYATVLSVAVVVFAYLTNPSESSFRAFLTEQSFRHHLTKLDESKDSDSGVYFTRTDSRFHFANRASVAIRTPSHVYHNFVLFTIALVVPSRSDLSPNFSDTWFVGAFGGWWKGGLLHAWWVDSVTRSKDEEGTRPGVLNIKNLDSVDEYNVLPFSSFQTKPSRGSPPKLRDHQRHQRDGPPPARSTTPPPLPKSVSLPLHTSSYASHMSHSRSLPTQFANTHSANMFDQSPAIAELLRQITVSRASAHDLRTQLVDFQSISSQQRDLLHQELEQQRERKREEDSSRLELKSKTKNLEDSKRNAESNKRDVDKKLKSAESRRDDAARKIERLHAEISKSKGMMEEDQRWIRDGDDQKGEAEVLQEQLAHKKMEIKVAEDVVAALNLRAKEMEDRIVEERERLKKLVEEAHLRRLRQREEPAPQDDLIWPPFDHSTSMEMDAPVQMLSPRRKTISLGSSSIPEPKGRSGATVANFAPFDDTPAVDKGMLTPSTLISSSVIRSISSGGTPSDMELSRSFQSDSDPFIIRSDRACLGDWRRNSGGGDGFISSSPTSLNGPRFFDETPYETTRPGYFDPELRPSQPISVDSMDLQRAFLRLPNRNSSDPLSPAASSPNLTEVPAAHPPRRWFSVKERKALNPQAEEFSLAHHNASTHSFLKLPISTTPGFDALNPSTGLTPSTSTNTPSSTSAPRSSFFYKAFAPSPAERAALGVGVGSLERLPSLSDVGSLNTSPVAPAAVPAVVAPAGEGSFARSMAWLNALPRRKPKFSPWDDDDEHLS